MLPDATPIHNTHSHTSCFATLKQMSGEGRIPHLCALTYCSLWPSWAGFPDTYKTGNTVNRVSACSSQVRSVPGSSSGCDGALVLGGLLACQCQIVTDTHVSVTLNLCH